jgi:hypothetical protein
MEPLSAEDPTAIGEFRLHARLGAGGMGQVYLGFSPAGRPVAIKVVHSQFANDQEFLQRFSREVAAASAVSGMYTAPVVGSGLNDHPPWLATAYVPGPPLAAVVGRYGPLPEAAVWRLAAGLAEALHAVHAVGLVHRDLKPANVLLADDGPHVIDFGISRAFQGTQLTSAGMVIGTPGYMSPEQAEGAPSGPPSDIFSLGCVLAYSTTGNAPFGDGTAASILYRVVRTEPDLSGLPAGLRQLVEACLKKDPAQRPDTVQLVGLISALGPATVATLGSFWPEAVARVIASERASQTPEGLTPPAAVPGPFASGMPAPTQTARPGDLAAAAPGPAGVERTPTALAIPGVAPGTTGHAPMISDGYYAAAAQPRPSGPGPSIAPLSPAPYPAAPYSGQQYGGAPYSGPGSGSAYPGQAPSGPNPGGRGSGGPGSGGPGSGGHASGPVSGPGTPVPSYPGQPTPWPTQAGGGAQWPGNGTPSGPGGDALAQYRLGRRNPGSSEIPGPVHAALRLMYVGFAANVVALVASLMVFSRYNNTSKLHPLDSVASQQAGVMAFAVIADILGLICWVVIAVACRRGRGWTRIAGTVLLGLYTVIMLVVLARTHTDPGARFTTLVTWALGVAAVIPLWTQTAREFFATWRKR